MKEGVICCHNLSNLELMFKAIWSSDIDFKNGFWEKVTDSLAGLGSRGGRDGL
jgi:hypothetical protein